MQAFKTAILATSLVALADCAIWDKSPVCRDNWYGYRPGRGIDCDADNASKEKAARLAAPEKERQRLADELAAAQKQKQKRTLSSRVSDLEIGRAHV